MRLLKLRSIDLLYTNIPLEDYPEWENSTTYNKGDCVIVSSIVPNQIYESLIDNNTDNYPPDNCWNELENNYPEWDRRTTYNAGDRVKVSYEEDGITPLDVPQAFVSLSNGNLGNYPPSDETNWLTLDYWKPLGATNQWKMFDDKVKSQTTNSDYIEVVVSFSNCDAFALFNIYAKSLEWWLYDGDYTNEDNLVASGSISDLQEPVHDWYEYFYSEPVYKEDVYVGNLPLYANGQLKVKLNPLGSETRCGMFVIGRSRVLGDSFFGAKVGIIDFSTKEVDSEGNATLKEGNFVKLVECDVWLPTKWLDIVRKELAKVRATPAVYVFNSDKGSFDSLVVYGFYRNFDIIISNPAMSKCSIQVEGLI